MLSPSPFFSFFFFNDTATTEIYTLSLHDALPISAFERRIFQIHIHGFLFVHDGGDRLEREDRKSTRLNSSHSQISYAVFCLKKKKKSHDLPLTLHYICELAEVCTRLCRAYTSSHR